MDIEESIFQSTSEKGDTNNWRLRQIANRTYRHYNEVIRITMNRLLTHTSAVVIAKCLELIRVSTEHGSEEFAKEIDLKMERIKEFLDYESGVQQRYKREVLNQKVRHACGRCLSAIRKRNEDMRLKSREKEEFQELSKELQSKSGVLSKLVKRKKTYTESKSGMSNVNKIGRISQEKQIYKKEKIVVNEDVPKKGVFKRSTEIIQKAGRGMKNLGSSGIDHTKKLFHRDPYKKGEGLYGEENQSNVLITDDGLVMDQRKLESGKVADDSGVAEKEIVDDFIKVGGVRVNPTKEEINKFLERCDNVKSVKIAECLNEKLKVENWTEQYRSLIGIKALLENENSFVNEYFQENKSYISRLRYVEQTPISKNANEILRMISGTNMFENMIFEEDEEEEEKKEESRPKEATLLDFF